MNEPCCAQRGERYGACADVSAGCREPFTKGTSLPGSYPQIAGAALLREHLHAPAGRCFRQPPRRAHGTLQPPAESVIVGYTL